MKNLFLLLLFVTIFLSVFSLNTAQAQTAYGGTAGNANDTWVINDDRTNVFSALRLQTGTNQAFFLSNKGAGLHYYYSTSTSNFNDEGTHLMSILSNGNVGIGTTSPTAKLHILGSASIRLQSLNKATSFIEFNNDDARSFRGLIGVDGFGFSGQANQFSIATWSPHPIKFFTNQIERLAIDANGNVGIGTSNPTKAKLEVVGSFHVENEQGQQTFHVSAGKQLVFVGDSAYIQYNATLNKPNSPIQQNKFSMWVSKGIVTQDLAIVNPSSWSDFVFEKDYNLLSIEEVATYIAAHGHLPEMPSESEIKAQGYSVHDINTKLLQKIEELTLYSIQQENKLKAQEAKLEAQQKQYNNLEQRIKQLEGKQ